MTISNVVLVVLLIQQARRLGHTQLAWLFLTYIAIVFILSRRYDIGGWLLTGRYAVLVGWLFIAWSR